jgi:hypothetical protein
LALKRHRLRSPVSPDRLNEIGAVKVLHRPGNRGKGSVIQAIAGTRTADFAADNPGFAQYLQMLRNGRLRKRQVTNNLAAAAAVAADPGECPYYGKPRRMSQRLHARGKDNIFVGKSHKTIIVIRR